MSISLLLMATLAIALVSSKYFEDVAVKREEDGNRDQASARAAEVSNIVRSFVEKANVVAGLLYKQTGSVEEKQKNLELSFYRDNELVSVEVYTRKSGKPQLLRREVNAERLVKYKLEPDYISQLHQKKMKVFPIVNEAFAGKVEIRNFSVKDAIPLLTVALPLERDPLDEQITAVAVADFRLDRIQNIFAKESEREIYMVDADGLLVAHPNDDWVLNNYNMTTVPIVKDAIEQQTVNQKQMTFKNPYDKNNRYIGAFVKTPPFHLTVVSQASEDIILEPARNVKRRAFLISGIVVSLGILIVSIMAFTLTNPIEILLDLTREIAKGNFDVHANDKIHSHDEVGELADAFDQMTDGLRERDKVKNMFSKFHGSSVTDDLLSGELNLGGSRKEVCVFFSDIRGFTKFSEGKTPEEVVDMLNEYFQVMVSIINKNQGIVDKFIGDAIMAVWGAPTSTGDDTYLATKACLEMRQALEKLNEKRLSRGQTAIMIGMGLHVGEAISGTIGSEERMEYTVIGDTVNMSSRIEASTKAFGADLLLSGECADTVKERFVVELAGKAEVKGKSKPLELYKVRGYIREDGQQELIRTPYSDYQAEKADKVKVA